MRRWLLLAAVAATHAFDAFDAFEQPPDKDPYDEEDDNDPYDEDDYLDGDGRERDDDPFGVDCEGRAVYNVLAKRNFCVVNGTWADEFVRRVEGFTIGWEPQTRALIHAHLAGVVKGGNTTTTLEAGMHVGDHLLPLASAFPSLTFVGVDPDATKCDFVRDMALRHNLTNVRVYHNGLAARDRACALDVSDANPGGWAIDERRRLMKKRLLCRTVDSFLEDVSDLGLLHLDVEGAELRALRGARATLRSARPLLVFENNHLSNDTQYGTAALLEAHGYVKQDEVEHNEVWAPSLVESGRRLRRPRRSRPVLL